MSRHFWIVLGIVVMFSGCIDGEPESLPPEKASTAETPPAAETVEQAEGVKSVTNEIAHVGMGAKGSGYGGGPITEPVSAYFRMTEMITLNQIKSAMNTFKALNERHPKDWDEFEKEILKPAHLKLPELPQGKKYSYDPEKGELIVQTINE